MAPPTPQVIGSPYTPIAVAYVAVARIADKAVLAQKSERSSSGDLQSFEAAAGVLVDRAAKLPAYPGWKDKVPIQGDLEACSGSTLYALADAKALFVVLAGIKGAMYPERVVQELLQELAGKVRATVSEERLSEAKPRALNGELRGSLKEAIKSYSDPAKVDKIVHVQVKVDQVKDLMQDNVKKILETHVTLEHLQNQSQSMTDSADSFLKRSTALKHQTQWRNVKVKLAVGASIAALFFVTGVPVLHSIGAL